MTTRSRRAAPDNTKDPLPGPKGTLLLEKTDGKPRARLLAEVSLSSVVPNTLTARTFLCALAGELDIHQSVAAVGERVAAVQGGDLKKLEATLTAQTVALDAIFNEMARRAAMNMGEYLIATETYMRVALKAQAQCRATVETLFEMKHPPAAVAFVHQANIANGPQQVNNGPAPLPRPRTRTRTRARGIEATRQTE